MTGFSEPSRECERCPRLRAFLLELRKSHPEYYNAPVPSFGDADPELLVVGLAPGMHGANRTGRPFTGDWAGDLLYAALAEYGFLRGVYDSRADDGMTLIGAQITNAIRCLPPGNKPIGAEGTACRPFLVDQIASFKNLKIIMTLGKISHDNTVRALGLRLKDFPFGHHKVYNIDSGAGGDAGGGRQLISSYHCSRYNTNTKRLTEEMFYAVFADIRKRLDAR